MLNVYREYIVSQSADTNPFRGTAGSLTDSVFLFLFAAQDLTSQSLNFFFKDTSYVVFGGP